MRGLADLDEIAVGMDVEPLRLRWRAKTPGAVLVHFPMFIGSKLGRLALWAVLCFPLPPARTCRLTIDIDLGCLLAAESGWQQHCVASLTQSRRSPSGFLLGASSLIVPMRAKTKA